jgi:hypothetical protein
MQALKFFSINFTSFKEPRKLIPFEYIQFSLFDPTFLFFIYIYIYFFFLLLLQIRLTPEMNTKH